MGRCGPTVLVLSRASGFEKNIVLGMDGSLQFIWPAMSCRKKL
jgi:hypothetical protein